MTITRHDLDFTRLVEEVPGVPENERYYLWSGGERCIVWRGSTKARGEEWALENGLTIEQFEPFEP